MLLLPCEIHHAWIGAFEETEDAYLVWCEGPPKRRDDAYAVYRAAADARTRRRPIGSNSIGAGRQRERVRRDQRAERGQRAGDAEQRRQRGGQQRAGDDAGKGRRQREAVRAREHVVVERGLKPGLGEHLEHHVAGAEQQHQRERRGRLGASASSARASAMTIIAPVSAARRRRPPAAWPATPVASRPPSPRAASR